ncbi:MAG: tetratricopeptide repeat protein [Cyanobacteria bacterium HKST-UBA03]|nr:tetratricopeptide repeat protein [Cyanobacteria bacterium HKST-UBA03]
MLIHKRLHALLQPTRLFRLSALSILSMCTAALLLCCNAFADETQEAFKEGLKAFNAQQYDTALTHFNKSIELDPKFVDGYYNKAVVHYQLKQFDDAIKSFNKVLELAPDDYSARYNLGLVYKKSGNAQKALAAFETIPSSHPRYQDAMRNIQKIKDGDVGSPQQPAANEKTAAATPTTASAAKPESKPAPAKTSNKPAAKSESKTATAKTTSKPAAKAASSGSLKAQEYATGFSGPTGLVTDANGNLFVANFSKNTIFKVQPNGDKALFAAGSGINGPVGMTSDEAGNLYVANHLDNSVAMITPAGKISIIAKDLNKPYNIFYDTKTKTLYVSQQGSDSVAKIILQ